MPTVSPRSAPEVLSLELSPAERLSRRTKIALLLLGLAVIAGSIIWRAWPAPVQQFSLDDLRGVYAGMVRSDGTNDASMITRANSSEQSGYLTPSVCEPLFEATVLNRVPQDAVDGVGTYWELNHSAVSLSTYRFADPDAADREFDRLSTAFARCQNLPVSIHARPAVLGTVTGVPVVPAAAEKQLSYQLTTDDGTLLIVHVLAFSNTVTWQFRYIPPLVPYTPDLAQRVMESLGDQMRAVLAMHE